MGGAAVVPHNARPNYAVALSGSVQQAIDYLGEKLPRGRTAFPLQVLARLVIGACYAAESIHPIAACLRFVRLRSPRRALVRMRAAISKRMDSVIGPASLQAWLKAVWHKERSSRLR